jgi:hypothetical protein
MPTARVCACGRITTRTRCPDCERAHSRQRATEPQSHIRNSAAWQRARAAAKARDNGCAMRTQGGCNGRLEVHHRTPIAAGGNPYDLANLLTLCRTHHEQAERTAERPNVAKRFFWGSEIPHPQPAQFVFPAEATGNREEGPSVG